MENEQALCDGQPTTAEQGQTEQTEQAPPLRTCVRCNATLYGDYCSMCGLPEGGYAPYTYTPPQKKKLRLTALWVTLGTIFLVAVNVGVFALIMVISNVPNFERGGFGEDYYYDEPYGEFDFNFEYTNETAYMRVDALGTSRVAGTAEFPAPEGKEYLIVNLRIVNLFEDIVAYDAANFELCCGKGNLVPVQYTDIDMSTALNYGRLLPQGEVEGSIVFLIPKDDLNLELFMYDYDDSIRFPLL